MDDLIILLKIIKKIPRILFPIIGLGVGAFTVDMGAFRLFPATCTFILIFLFLWMMYEADRR